MYVHFKVYAHLLLNHDDDKPPQCSITLLPYCRKLLDAERKDVNFNYYHHHYSNTVIKRAYFILMNVCNASCVTDVSAIVAIS